MSRAATPLALDPVRELKVRAEVLHKHLATGDARARSRLRALHEHRHSDDASLLALAPEIQRKHCLAVVARECGFANWEHACRVLRGDPREHDFGTLLYQDASGTLNQWFASYEEAREALDRGAPSSRTYLLAYKRHFFVAYADLVRDLGMDPDDPDWRAIGWDWARPDDPSARMRLYFKRLLSTRVNP
jgi:hypothetical protein